MTVLEYMSSEYKTVVKRRASSISIFLSVTFIGKPFDDITNSAPGMITVDLTPIVTFV